MKLSSWLLAALVSLFPAASHAALIERDWQTPGDRLLTYDTVNQREWLDVPLSRLSNFPNRIYADVVNETGPGGLFEGFHVAQSGDVIALAESAGIDIDTADFSINGVPAGVFVDSLGPTLNSTLTIGLVDELDESGPNPNLRLAVLVGSAPSRVSAGLSLVTETSLGLDPNGLVPIAGVWLYRPVPEPCSLLMLIGSAVFLVVPRTLRGPALFYR